jgi:hypothetical protein
MGNTMKDGESQPKNIGKEFWQSVFGARVCCTAASDFMQPEGFL